MSEVMDDDVTLAALISLLDTKGLVTPAEIAERIEVTDRANPEIGARVVARAWTDPDFRELLLRDGTTAVESLGISMRGAPPLGVAENTPDRHHLVVCTLCSCYPRNVLGYPPFWFKSPAYRARAVREPRVVLKNWGTVLPDEVKIRVIDSTADYRWMVLPMRPSGSDGLDEPALGALVRDTDMIGVTVPSVHRV